MQIMTKSSGWLKVSFVDFQVHSFWSSHALISRDFRLLSNAPPILHTLLILLFYYNFLTLKD